jgi:HK97 family phage major capsid protein
MGAPNEFTIEDVKAELKKIGDQVKEAGEKALAEAKKHGDMYAADKPKVDEMLVKQGELQARVLEVEQKAARQVQDFQAAYPQTVGHSLINSPEFKAWIDGGGMKTRSSSHAFPFKSAIISTPTTNTTTIGVPPHVVPGIVELPQQKLRVRDLLTPGRTSSGLLYYIKETGFTNAAATVSEGILKPESTITYDDVQSPVVTIAHWIKASKIILDDFAQLQSAIDGRLRYGLKLVEETQLLKGSGVGHNLNGIYTQATAYSAPFSMNAPTMIDTLRLMMLQASVALFPASGIVLNELDWARIELLKDTTNRYIIGNPQGTINPTLWGLPVVESASMTAGTALVGAFKMGAQIFDREDANVVIATENDTDFVKNLITIRCEERLGLAVYRPGAFIKNADLPPTG